MIAYVNGICRLDDAKVPLDDRLGLLGDGVFETMRTVGQGICFLDAHMRRLAEGLSVMGMPDLVDEAKRVAQELAAAPGIEGDRRIRINVSAGRMEGMLGARNPAVTGLATPLTKQTAPVALRSSAMRKDPQSPLCKIKHASYAPFFWARRDAQAHGADDALLWNTEGRVAEATTSNIFVFLEGTVYTPGPEEGALPGVTRDVMLGLLRGMEIPVREILPRGVLALAEEAWLSNTSSGAVAVASIDGRRVPGGPLVAKLQQAYAEVLLA